MKRKTARRRIEVNLEELDRIIDHGTRAPLSEADGQKIKAALHAMADRLTPKRTPRRPAPSYRRPLRSLLPQQTVRTQPDTDETVPLPLRAQPESRSRMPRFSPVTLVRNAAREKSTGKRNQPR